jgi:hypothetical protein
MSVRSPNVVKVLSAFLLACGIIFLIGFQNSIADQSRREIKQVSGDLYSVHDGNNTYAALQEGKR